MAERSSTRWLFHNDAPGAAPVGFSFTTTGGGRAGRWSIRIDEGRRVLAQIDADKTKDRFPIAVADALRLDDPWVEVRCKLVSGTLDEACGLVFRYRDENNYYVARASALADDVRLYQIVNGRRPSSRAGTGRSFRAPGTRSPSRRAKASWRSSGTAAA
jgi:hypothetical protein